MPVQYDPIKDPLINTIESRMKFRPGDMTDDTALDNYHKYHFRQFYRRTNPFAQTCELN